MMENPSNPNNATPSCRTTQHNLVYGVHKFMQKHLLELNERRADNIVYSSIIIVMRVSERVCRAICNAVAYTRVAGA